MSNNTSLLELVFGLFDRLVSAPDGKTKFYNILILLIIFFIGFTIYQWEELKELYKDSRFETFQESIKETRITNFKNLAQQQAQVLYKTTTADLVVIYEYYPPNQQFFYNAIYYEGELPNGMDEIKDFQAVPIDKTTKEYKNHLDGMGFYSSDFFNYIPSEFRRNIKFTYSCPIFNLSNVYAGNISMFWYEEQNEDEDKLLHLQSLCAQSSRVLGRAK